MSWLSPPWRALIIGVVAGLAIGLLGSWVHLSVHNVLDTLYVNNAHLHIAALMGLLVFLLRRQELVEQQNQFVVHSGSPRVQ